MARAAWVAAAVAVAAAAAAVTDPGAVGDPLYAEAAHVHPLAPPPPCAGSADPHGDRVPVAAWLWEAVWSHSAPAPASGNASGAAHHLAAFPREVAALADAQGVSPGCGLAHLTVSVAAGAWEHEAWGPPPTLAGQPAQALLPPPGVTVHAEYADDAGACAAQAGVHLPPATRWRELLPALSRLLGGIPLSAGLVDGVHGGAAGAALAAPHHGEEGGAASGWHTHHAARGGGARAATPGMPPPSSSSGHAVFSSFSLHLPPSPALGSGGGLPWSRVVTSLVAQLSPCGAAAGLAAVVTPPAVLQLVDGRHTHAGMWVAASLVLGPGDGARGGRLSLNRSFAAVLQQPPVNGDSGGGGGASSARSPRLVDLWPSAALPEGHRGRWEAGSGGEGGPRLRRCSLTGWGDDADADADDWGGGVAHTHEPPGFRLRRSPPTAAPLSTMPWLPLPTSVPRAGFGPATDRGTTLRWAGRQATQHVLGAGELTATVALLPGATTRRVRLAVVTPMPWFLGDAPALAGEGRAAAEGWGTAGGAMYLRAPLAGVGGSGAAPTPAQAHAWLRPREGRLGCGVAHASIVASSVGVAPGADAHAGWLGVHVAVVDVALGTAHGSERVTDAASGAPPPAVDDCELTLALSLPYRFPGVMHAEAVCPADTHRGLDAPGAVAHIAELGDDGGGDDESRLPQHWMAGALAPADAARLLAACFSGGGNATAPLQAAGCPPHPWGRPQGPPPTAHGITSAHLRAVTVEPPCPDFSMPYNAVVLVCTAAAFVLGTFVNVTARKRRVPAAGGRAAGAPAEGPEGQWGGDDGGPSSSSAGGGPSDTASPPPRPGESKKRR